MSNPRPPCRCSVLYLRISVKEATCFGFNAGLRQRLKQAETILDIQKKASELLGIPLNRPSNADDE